MKTLSERAQFYRQRFGGKLAVALKHPPAKALRISIVIPAYAEKLDATLASLGRCALEDSRTFEVILVLNHSDQADAEVKRLHAQQAEELQNQYLANGLKVQVIEAFDLPKKHAGVGLARKIGMDEALYRFAEVEHDGLVVCLDGDCEVPPNYLAVLADYEKRDINGLSLHFEHRLDQLSETERERIIAYENWLRYYIQALRWAGYPHAFHTIGSSMAVRASAYAKIGGMNRRKAGEDFYFLHKLIPQGSFVDCTELTVYPSARISERVPFGTGRAMLEMESGRKAFESVYHPQIFRELKALLVLQEGIFRGKGEEWPGAIYGYFKQQDWLSELTALKKRSRDQQQLMRNFSHWFDGFKVLKLVHHLRDEVYGLKPAMAAAKELLAIEAGTAGELLQGLRRLDKAALKR